jgi:hypothetical protein
MAPLLVVNAAKARALLKFLRCIYSQLSSFSSIPISFSSINLLTGLYIILEVKRVSQYFKSLTISLIPITPYLKLYLLNEN